MKARTLAYVTWLDAAYLGADWRNVGDLRARDHAMMESAGFVVKETREGLYLAGDADPDEEGRYRHLSFIPRPMVKRIRRFKVK